MSAPNREVFANSARTTLNGSINNSTTTIVVDNGSVFPSTGNFRLRIEDELILCTARSSNTLTVIRGIEGSSAVSHGDGAQVGQIVTVGGLTNLAKDNAPLAGYAPPLNTLVAADGITPLTSSDFTWVNQGSASVSDLGGTMCLRAPPSASTSNHALVVSAPSPPYTLVAAVQVFSVREDAGNANPIIGLILRESSTGKLIDFSANAQSIASMRFGINYWTDEFTYAGTTPWKVTNPIFHSNLIWYKIVDNNTNLVFSMGIDGAEWIQVASLSRTAHMSGGPNQIGIANNNGGNSGAWDSLLRLVHWHTE